MAKLLDASTLKATIADNESVPARLRRSRHPEGVVTGTLTGITSGGEALVRIGRTRTDLIALATTSLDEADIGEQVAVVFTQGDQVRPIVFGVMRRAIVPENA